ncbi:hypothetical protein B0H14DRAFT_2604757 [Mycena olivaceomarginata]|nr:hypothetical protein B0H14DRAFT_2604757 [Mycena olivaceomarginata]
MSRSLACANGTMQSLDIISTVVLSYSFSMQSMRPNDLHSNAAPISSSWTKHVNVGLKPFAFLAPIVIRAIPTVTRAPLPLMQSQGVVKTIATRLTDGEDMAVAASGSNQAARMLGHTNYVIYPASRNRPRKKFPSYGRDLSDDDIQKIEFLDAVVKEGRVYP